MGIKIGINGFGRIGRVVMRILTENPEKFEVCGINLRKADIDYMVYLLKYDSIFRNFPGTVEHAGGDLVVNGHKIKIYSESDAAMINWADCGAEYIIESTGANNTTDKASRHFKGGAKKVLLTAPAKDEVTPTFVYGVNSELYQPDMMVVSNASCTTNCLAPLAKVIHQEFGIEQSLMSTIHASTAKQKAVDSRGGSDWRTGRSILNNIIPTSTGAAKAVGHALAAPGAGRIIVCARRLEHAAALAAQLPGCGEGIVLAQDAIQQAAAACDLLVNATPLGMAGSPAFARLDFLQAMPPHAVVYDLVYHPRRTALLEAAEGAMQ